MGHVILCGLGDIGFRTFELLHRSGERVVVIGQRSSPEWRGVVESSGATFIDGDARDEALLLRARLPSAKAVIAVTDQDLVNLSVAMDARRLAPNARIVVRLFDLELGRHVMGTLKIDRVFSTTALAAPVFASSALGHHPLALLTLHGGSYALGETGLALDPGEIPLWVHEGRTLVLEPIETLRSPKAIERFWGLPRLIDALPRNFRLLIAVLLMVIATSTVIVRQALDLSFIDALYFTVTTLTTVGYGDINFAEASTAAKLFGCVMMLSGATLMALLFSTMTDLLLSEKLARAFGGRPVPTKDHTLVFGSGHIADRVVDLLLAAGAEPVLLESELTGPPSVDLRRRVAAVPGDPRSPETLARAGVERARALLAISDDDVENLGVALAARTMNPALRTAVRTFDVELGARLQWQLGLDRVLSVPSLAAPYFAGAIVDPRLLMAVNWCGHLVLLSEVDDPEGAVVIPGRGAVRVTVVGPGPGGDQSTSRVHATSASGVSHP